MSVAVEGDSFLEETAFQHWAMIPVYVSDSSFSLNRRKLNCIHNTRMAFLCKLCVQSPHQGNRAPYQDCRLLSPPCTNKQDPRPFMITHVHSAKRGFDKRGSGVGDGISWLISVDYLCQQWFSKLIAFYLHQYQTFLVKTARSEYTMPSYY